MIINKNSTILVMELMDDYLRRQKMYMASAECAERLKLKGWETEVAIKTALANEMTNLIKSIPSVIRGE